MNLTKHFQIINIEVEDKKLDDLKILHLSDLHINKKTSIEKILELVNFCNSLEFDFCIITGDIIDTKVKFIKKQLEILNLLKKEVFYPRLCNRRSNKIFIYN